MRPLHSALGLALLLGAGGLDGGALPRSHSGFEARLEKAEAAYYRARAGVSEGEAAVRPLAEDVEELKSRAQHSWYSRFRLSRKLASLQGGLDRLREARLAAEAARQELFLVLSALQEEARGEVEKELDRGKDGGLDELRGLLASKRAWDSKLEDLGFSEARPFPMNDNLSSEAGRLSAQDRKKALEARSVQLEACASLVEEDLRLHRRPRVRQALGDGAAKRRVLELEDLTRRIALLSRENDRLMSKN